MKATGIMRMTLPLWGAIALLACAPAGAMAIHHDGGNAKACFARLKSLAGDWVQTDAKTGKSQVALRYRLTAGGTAVEEVEFPGAPHEMVTLYHMDGDNLVLTHYCGLGNQPHMRATDASTPEKIFFECSGEGGNMKSHEDMHMHALKLTLAGRDHLLAEWTLSSGGKPGHEAKFDVRRKSKS